MFDWLKNLFKSTEQIEREAADKYFGDAGDNVVVNEEHDDAMQLEEQGNTLVEGQGNALVEGQGNTLVENSAPISKEPEFTKGQTMSGGRDKLQYLQGILEASQKGGRGSGNSEKFTAVTEALDEINAHMNSDHFSDKAENNFEIMGPMVDRYNRLIAACSAYLSRSSFTSAGKHRQAIISEVLSLANQDISGINVAMDQVGRADPASMASTKWNDILNKARAVKLDVDLSVARNEDQGEASEVFKLNGKNSLVEGNDGALQKLESTKFFKPMMTFDANKTDRQQALELFVQKQKVTKKEYDYLAGLSDTWKEKATGKLPEDPRLCEFAMQLKAIEHSMFAVSTSFVQSSAENKGLGEFNITNRNVATSRMADLLGVSNIVARSELAEITDKLTGEKKQGIIMDSAEGVSGGEMQAKHKKAVAKKNWDMTETDYTDTSKNLMTPTFVKQMMQLGILDYICGQVDRHSNNFKVQLDEDGRAMSLQGFDNDGSFGLHTGFSGGKYANQVYDLDGNLLHPIDKAIADRIQSISSSAIKYALRGLIADDCIDACITRLNNVKQAIQKAPEDMIISNDAGWGAETQQKMFDKDRQRASSDYSAEQLEKYNYKNGLGKVIELGSASKELLAKMYGDRTLDSLSEDEEKAFNDKRRGMRFYESLLYTKSLSTIGMFAFDHTRA